MNTFLEIYIYKILILITLFGSLNIGLIGLFNINLIYMFSTLFGSISIYIEKIIYIIIGILALTFLLRRETYLPFLGSAEFPKPLADSTPQIEGQDIEHTIKALKPNTKVIYWASIPADSADTVINDPITAYGNELNQGVGTTDEFGEVTIKLKKPSIYIVPFKGKLLRHFHYRYWINDMTSPVHTVYV